MTTLLTTDNILWVKYSMVARRVAPLDVRAGDCVDLVGHPHAQGHYNEWCWCDMSPYKYDGTCRECDGGVIHREWADKSNQHEIYFVVEKVTTGGGKIFATTKGEGIWLRTIWWYPYDQVTVVRSEGSWLKYVPPRYNHHGNMVVRAGVTLQELNRQ